MKKLHVPYLSVLDSLDLSSVKLLMETKASRHYIDVVNWSSYPYKPIVAFDIARSETALYLHYFVHGHSLKASCFIDNSPVYTDSCVEFFMLRPKDSYYMNFEFNCIGTCDAAVRQSRELREPLSAAEYASIRRHTSLEKKSFEEIDGIFSWDLTVAIPLTLMGLDPGNLPEMIRGNFYKCADDTAYPHYLSWNPVETLEPDFHRPEFFGEIYL